jgi:hypothetical protein
MTLMAKCTCDRWPHLETCDRAPLAIRPPRTQPGTVKLPQFWQDMGIGVGVYLKLPSGEEPVYLGMKCDVDTLETAIRFLRVIQDQQAKADTGA